MKLWAWRHSVGTGWRWICERECEASTGEQWLAVFRESEPDVVFVLSSKRPRK